jgi:hypothetical protein
MPRHAGAVALALVLVWCAHVAAESSPADLWVWGNATAVPILTPSIAQGLGVTLVSQFEVLPGGRVVALTTAGELFDLTARKPLPATSPLHVTSFTSDHDLLITIRGQRLGWYEEGKIVDRIQLPQSGLTVVAGSKQRLHLYGGRGNGSVIYLLEQGRAGLLVEIPNGQVSAFTAIGERLFFAVGNTIYTLAAGQPPAVLFIAAGQTEIRSLAPDPVSGMLCFSAGETVYAMRAGVAVSILRGLAGVLRHAGDALYVLDPAGGTLVQVRGLEKLIGGGGLAGSAEKPGATPFKE